MGAYDLTTNDIELMKLRHGYGDERMLEWDTTPSDNSNNPMFGNQSGSSGGLTHEEEMQFLADEAGISTQNDDGGIWGQYINSLEYIDNNCKNG